MDSHSSAGSSKAIAVIFKIDVQTVLITPIDANPAAPTAGIEYMSVCFNRAHRLSSTKERKVRMLPGCATSAEFNESLSLMTTLLRDNRTGNYKEKLARLVVRSKKDPAFTNGGTGYRGLGLASLPLHRLVADFQSQHFNIPLTNNAQAVGSIDVIISSKLVGEVNIDDVSDSESAGQDVAVELADFEDPLSATGESKWGSVAPGDDGNTSSGGAVQALDDALAAALAANKAYVRKNEELIMEVEALRTAAQQPSQQQQQSRSAKRVSGLLEQELEQCKEKISSLELKLQQAAEFVNFQEEQIQDLKDEMEDQREQADIRSGKYAPTSPTSNTRIVQLRDEVVEQKELVEKLTTQIRDGASYVQQLQEQLDLANEEVSRLRAVADAGDDSDDDGDGWGRGSGKSSAIDALKDELATKNEKITKAAKYVQYQENVINELTAELEDLKLSQDGQKTSDDSGSVNAMVAALLTQVAELEGRLGQGATYCEFIQGQVDAAKAEAEAYKHALAELPALQRTVEDLRAQVAAKPLPTMGDDDMQREFDQSQRLCEAYQLQVQRGGAYVDELKTELVDTQKRLHRLEKLLVPKATRPADRVGQLEAELAAAFQELDKARAKVAAGGASATEVLYYKSQNETYLLKLQQGADYVDSLQSQLQRVEAVLGGELEHPATVAPDHVVQELIEYKMKFASAATTVDHERRKSQEAAAKLQAAAQRISALEGALAAAQAASDKPRSLFSFFSGSSSSGAGGSDNARGRSSSHAMSPDSDSSYHGSQAGSVAGSEAGYRRGMRPGQGVGYGPGPGMGMMGAGLGVGVGTTPPGRAFGPGQGPYPSPGSGPGPGPSPGYGGPGSMGGRGGMSGYTVMGGRGVGGMGGMGGMGGAGRGMGMGPGGPGPMGGRPVPRPGPGGGVGGVGGRGPGSGQPVGMGMGVGGGGGMGVGMGGGMGMGGGLVGGSPGSGMMMGRR